MTTNSPMSLLDFIRRWVGVGELVCRRVDCNSLLTDLRLRANYNFASWTLGLICSPYILSPAFCKTSWITQIELSKLTFLTKILVCCPSNILIFWRELLGLSVFTIFSFLLILVCCHCWKNYFLCSAFDHTFV